MKQGVLCLNDAPFRALRQHADCARNLAFGGREPLLVQAQEALWELRRQSDWICVAAEGPRAFIALALAAQLPVERLALMGKWKAAPWRSGPLRGYALRNLPLVISDVLLIGAADREIKTMLHGRRHGGLCVLNGQSWADCGEDLLSPWAALAQKNLINSIKCV